MVLLAVSGSNDLSRDEQEAGHASAAASTQQLLGLSQSVSPVKVSVAKS